MDKNGRYPAAKRAKKSSGTAGLGIKANSAECFQESAVGHAALALKDIRDPNGGRSSLGSFNGLVQDLSPLEKGSQSLLDLQKMGVGTWAAGQKDEIPSGEDRRDQLAYGLSQAALSAVSFYSFSQGAASSHCDPGRYIIGWQSDQHNKRVGIRLSQPPHPLEIG
jgi:hypothetical protein